jgi:hypothetical protein
MKKRMGRPPVPAEDQLSEIVQFRLTPNERKACEAAAERAGVRFSAWIRERLIRAARRDSKGG